MENVDLDSEEDDDEDASESENEAEATKEEADDTETNAKPEDDGENSDVWQYAKTVNISIGTYNNFMTFVQVTCLDLRSRRNGSTWTSTRRR